MTIFKILIAATLLPFMITSSDDTKLVEYTLQGIVASKENGKALSDIYLYTVKGEEEAITNQKGEFRFVTWKQLPVTIHVHSKDADEIRVIVTNPSELIKIKL